MATLTAVSEDTPVLYAQYVIEPIIAAAAAFGEMAGEGRIDQLLENIASLLASGSASEIFAARDSGEFAASFMLMRAYHRALLADATKPSYAGMPVTLGSCLDAMLGPSALHQHGGAKDSSILTALFAFCKQL